VSEPRMTLHAKMLGRGADGERASVIIESLLMAQIALVLARLGVPDLIAARARPVADLAAQHEELMAEEGYRLVRDTPLARVLPWRILEFQHG
jgi:hypothetical protein